MALLVYRGENARRPRKVEPVARIVAGLGRIILNNGIIRQIPKYHWAVLYYDPDESKIVIKLADKTDDYAVHLAWCERQVQIMCIGFFRTFELDSSVDGHYECTYLSSSRQIVIRLDRPVQVNFRRSTQPLILSS